MNIDLKKIFLSVFFLFFLTTITNADVNSRNETSGIKSESAANSVEGRSHNSIFDCLAKNWKTVALRYAFIYVQAHIFYHAGIAWDEWRKGAELSGMEKELLWLEMLSAILIAEYCWRGIGCCSSKDKDEETVQEESTCPSQV